MPLDLAIIGSVIDHQLMISVDPAGICFADMDALRRTFCLGKRPINPADGVFYFFSVVTILSTYISLWLA
jgi:hypothetical protein